MNKISNGWLIFWDSDNLSDSLESLENSEDGYAIRFIKSRINIISVL